MAAWLQPMDTGASAAAPGGDAKTRRTGPTLTEHRSEDLNHKIQTIQNAQDIRLLKAAALLTYLVPATLVADADKVNKDFGNRTRGQPGHKLGPPHPHSWRVFLRALEALATQKLAVTDLEGQNPSANQALILLKQYLIEYEKNDIASSVMSISIFRFKVTREKTSAIVSFTLSQLMPPPDRHALQSSIHILLLLCGADLRAGPPPALQAERSLQTAIDRLKAEIA
jgi:hypothetical protein